MHRGESVARLSSTVTDERRVGQAAMPRNPPENMLQAPGGQPNSQAIEDNRFTIGEPNHQAIEDNRFTIGEPNSQAIEDNRFTIGAAKQPSD